MHCGRHCSSTNPILDAKRIATFQSRRDAVPLRVCEVCQGEFGRTKNENTKKYQARTICSRQCSATKRSRDRAKKAQTEGKTCKNPLCGKTFYRKVGVESLAKFKRRGTCSVNCGHKSRLKDPLKGPRRKNSAPGEPRKKKIVEEHTLPPVEPLKIAIPEPPKPVTRVVWRPEAWGGEYTVQVS